MVLESNFILSELNLFFLPILDAIMIVEIMVFVVPTLFVIVILAGWVKTAVLIVAVMGTATVLKALVFVTSVKVNEKRKNVRNTGFF